MRDAGRGTRDPSSFFEGLKRADIAHRVDISAKTQDNHLQAGFRSVRHLLTQDVEPFSDVDRLLCYDRIEKMSKRYTAARFGTGVASAASPAKS